MKGCSITIPVECGECNQAPYIGENGNWFIKNVDTGIKAAGQDGITPHIGENGNWYVGNEDTGVLAGSTVNMEGRLADLEKECDGLRSGLEVRQVNLNDLNGAAFGTITAISDFCSITGIINAEIAPNSVILTIPESFRPADKISFRGLAWADRQTFRSSPLSLSADGILKSESQLMNDSWAVNICYKAGRI